MKTAEDVYDLSPEVCDLVAGKIMDFCESEKVEKKDALRYRLSAEECLLFWLSHGCEGGKTTLRMSRRLHVPYISLEVSGPEGNPYRDAISEEDFGTGSELLSRLGLNPEYSFSKGRNRISFSLKRKSLGQLTVLCWVIVSALAVGLLGMKVLPDDVRMLLMEGIVTPVYDTFFKLLSCVAGPMIFLSVAWGIYGIGDAATFGRIGKKVMLTYVLIVFAITAAAAPVFFLLVPGLSDTIWQNSQLSSIMELVMGIFPSNIVEPFMTGNSMQIIFLAVVVGIALLFLGQKTSSVARAIEQINYMIQFMMGIISKIVPNVIFLVVVNMIWSGNLGTMQSAWKLVVTVAVSFVIISAVRVLYTAWFQKVDARVIVKKSIPSFLVALATASSAAAFNSNVTTCEKKFGINKSLVNFGIPLGMVIHNPAAGVYNLLAAFFFARIYNVSCSPVWILTAVFVSAILAIATPPIPGGGAIAYAIIFRQLGIPEDALAVALTVDIITDFLITAFDTFLLPLTLANLSSRLGMIDKDVLRNS